MDVMFRWTPFGLIGRTHGDYFIQQGKATRDKEILRLKDHLKKVFWDRDRRWVIFFPEGGFYYKRVESSQKYGRFSTRPYRSALFAATHRFPWTVSMVLFRYAREHGFPHLEHTTLPRQGAAKAILETIGPREDENNDEGLVKTRSGSRLKLLKDTVGAIREKKYVKGTRLCHSIANTGRYVHGTK